MRIAIVGAGIAGLSAAYELQKDPRFQVSILESSSLVGGKIQTIRLGDCLIEQGPDSVFTAKPWALDLMLELGMEPELIEPQSREFSILVNGTLHSVPREMAQFTPSVPGAMEKVDFLGPDDKRRVLEEPLISPQGLSDESIASFFRRRFGAAFSELVAEPLLAGTHAGNPQNLSMAALYPAYQKMEQDHGSIFQASTVRALRSEKSKVGFLSLQGGMAALPRRLAETLTQIHLATESEVLSISKDRDRLTLETSKGPLWADHAILATPAYIAADLLQEIGPTAAQELKQIRFVSTAVVTLAYPRNTFPEPLSGNGFLVPFHEPCSITGCTWSSNKWADRAPADTFLLRAFMGRDGGMEIDSLTDLQLIESALVAIQEILKPGQSPSLIRVDRWPRGLAQYEMGHLERLAKVESALEGLPVSLIGSSYRGNGIPDCIRQGQETAHQLKMLVA